MTGSGEMQVVVRHVERCERCGAVNSFRARRTIRDEGGEKMQYAVCRRCGAPAKVYWRDAGPEPRSLN